MPNCRRALRIFNLRLLRFESLAEENRARDIRESSAASPSDPDRRDHARGPGSLPAPVLINKGLKKRLKGQPVLDAEECSAR